ncbi:hypothetical protein CSOJ01_10288 [Colletotrichum sojae]|uniref:Uncharacterized protein n=1 Tax=Colletotrichum sojae TaxID=2175907 RepID=A0A8H6MPN1_9PEZI|nr:hypothetical protein CSOJ01_10288 [Colletotrichum sojae]
MAPHFFDLPTEVCDLIYLQCVLVGGGYVLDFNSNTLRGAGGHPIDLSFRLTCKRIASETKDLALSSNTLNFSTFHSPEHNAATGRFGLLIENLADHRGSRIDRIEPHILSIPDNIWDDIAKAHPRFAQYVEFRKNRPDPRITQEQVQQANVGSPGSCGDTPSAFRDFIFSALQTIMSHRSRLDPQQLADACRGYDRAPTVRPEALVRHNPSPWTIIDNKRIEEILSQTDSEVWRLVNSKWHNYFPGLSPSTFKQSYSAASTAIRFLKSLSTDSRMSIRSIVLNEDQRSVAFAECHGLGLIQYCQENVRLRIERRVSMWKVVFQTQGGAHGSCDVAPYDDNHLDPNKISYNVAIWILEALELVPAGMPVGCFTLTLDGDHACSEIFQTVIQRDAAWQTAIDLCLGQTLPAIPWDVRRRDTRNHRGYTQLSMGERDNSRYVFEAFPRAIQDIVAGNSIVKCGFELVDAAYDPERLAKDNKKWTMAEWQEAWYAREKETFNPDPPLPT